MLTRIITNPGRHYSRPEISTLENWACALRELLNESEENGRFLHTLPNFKTKSGVQDKSETDIQNREPKSGIDGVKENDDTRRSGIVNMSQMSDPEDGGPGRCNAAVAVPPAVVG